MEGASEVVTFKVRSKLRKWVISWVILETTLQCNISYHYVYRRILFSEIPLEAPRSHDPNVLSAYKQNLNPFFSGCFIGSLQPNKYSIWKHHKSSIKWRTENREVSEPNGHGVICSVRARDQYSDLMVPGRLGGSHWCWYVFLSRGVSSFIGEKSCQPKRESSFFHRRATDGNEWNYLWNTCSKDVCLGVEF